MTYTTLGVVGVTATILLDLFVFRTHLMRRRVFWTAYVIVVVFQFVTNGLLTGFGIVRYSDAAIIGDQIADGVSPPMFGSGRLFFAPIEDVLFGFTLVLLSCMWWVWLGRRGIQREPMAGPPRTAKFTPPI